MPATADIAVLIWPWPGHDSLPLTVADALYLARSLPDNEDPQPAHDGSAGVVVLAGDDATGQVLAITAPASKGVLRPYEDLIAAAANQGMFVYAGNRASASTGAARHYRAPDVNSRRQRRRIDHGALMITAADLAGHDWAALDDMPDAEVAQRARLLLAHPAGLEPLILRYANIALGESS